MLSCDVSNKNFIQIEKTLLAPEGFMDFKTTNVVDLQENVGKLKTLFKKKNVNIKLACCGHHKTFFYINVVH